MMASRVVKTLGGAVLPALRMSADAGRVVTRERTLLLRQLRDELASAEARGITSGKTSRSASKRFQVNASGLVRHNQVNRRHLLSGKGRARINRLGAKEELTGGQKEMALRLLLKK